MKLYTRWQPVAGLEEIKHADVAEEMTPRAFQPTNTFGADDAMTLAQRVMPNDAWRGK